MANGRGRGIGLKNLMCYYATGTGTGANQTITHGLGVIPAMVIIQVDDEATATGQIVSKSADSVVVNVTNAKTYTVLFLLDQ